MRRFAVLLAIVFNILPGVDVAVGAQTTAPITLSEAIAQALQKNPSHEMDSADVALARISTRLARTSLLPSLSFSEAATRGNDPVYVFGTKLRQQIFIQNDFALDSLNRPTPLNNFTTRFAGNWTAFDSLHTQFEIRRADLRLKSSQAVATRSDQIIVYRTVAAYEAILFATREMDVLQHAVETATASLTSSKTRVEAGLAIEADTLTATANLAERQQELIAAQGRVQIAWAELEAVIGEPIPENSRQAQPLTEQNVNMPPLPDAVDLAIKSRPDRQSLTLRREEQATSVHSASAAFGPQVNTYGSWEMDKSSFAGSGGNNWIAGVELRIDILPVAKHENLAAAKIDLQRADAAATAADQQIRLEVTRAYYEHKAAQQMLEVARATTSQASESLRLMKDRYDAGLATMTELLRVEDVQRQSQTNYWQAVFRDVLTYANTRFAEGTLNQETAGELQ
jgi:outer membrane protein TolC